MKTLSLILAIVIAALNTSAVADEHLEPCGNFLHEYESRIETISRGVIPGSIELSVTVIPSFEPEWSISVSIEKDIHYLTLVVFDQSLWQSSWVKTGPDTMKNDPSTGHATPKAKTTTISTEMYLALQTEWERSIKDARSSDQIGLDGVTYKFNLSVDQCASAWSPRSTTRNGKLVAVVNALRDLTEVKSNVVSSKREKAILQMLREIKEQ